MRSASAAAAATASLGALSAGWSDEARAAGLPVLDLVDESELAVGEPHYFNYPDDRSPAILVRLEGEGEGGVGEKREIVAFSLLCTHKGCPVQYRADRRMMICPCHWSTFDPAKAGTMIIGQASHSLPQIVLQLDGSRIQAVGINGLIYGRHTNLV